MKRLKLLHISGRRLRGISSQLKKKLQKAKSVAVLGIGNRLRRDDSAGSIVAEELKRLRVKHRIRNLNVFDAGIAPENFTGKVCEVEPSHIIIVDAVRMDKRPGKIMIIPASETGHVSFSTHNPALLITDYFRTRLDCRIILIGIQPGDTSFGEDVSEEVAGSCRDLAGIIINLLLEL